jgi:hypothetical protein
MLSTLQTRPRRTKLRKIDFRRRPTIRRLLMLRKRPIESRKRLTPRDSDKRMLVMPPPRRSV